MNRICKLLFVCVFPIVTTSVKKVDEQSWIRINLLGYKPGNSKVAIWCSKVDKAIKTFQLIDANSKKIVFSSGAGKPFGAYGPFTQTYRLNFSDFKKAGRYYLQAGGARSPDQFVHPVFI